MNTLPLNWIEFFHSAQFQTEIMQKLYKFITELSPNTTISTEEISSNIGVTNEIALNIINSLIKSNLLSSKLLCPECHENIYFSSKQIITCDNCDTEINIFVEPMAIINTDASLVHLMKESIDDKSYEVNAKLIEKIGKERGYLYYLLTDITDSQLKQNDNPDMYSLNLFQLWSDFWPEVMHISRKSSLQLYAKGDAVAWVFNEKEDLLKTINALTLYLCENPITNISVYASKILLPPNIKITLMRSLDKKWDLNTPSVTDFYRKTAFKPVIWERTNDYILKYCLFDCLEKNIIDNTYCFLKNGEKENYYIEGKHNYSYKGECFAGYCNANTMKILQKSPHA
ncbi:MAG: hypothetical protein FWD47_08445 [Treponema sp.]|nr:hypothetical protein [Treponema sp.]